MSKRYALLGQVVLGEQVIKNGAVVVDGSTIANVGARTEIELPETVIDYGDRLIMAGFIDIHCHAGSAYESHLEPAPFAAYHLKHGTTGLLGTIYRDISHADTMKAFEQIREVMKTQKNLLGVHMEGPYLNPQYGASQCGLRDRVRSEYMELIESGLIKQMTLAPEVEGTEDVLHELVKAGIAPAIGHSAASPEQVKAAHNSGARIVTHLFDATGCSIEPTRCGGTKEVNFDQAAMLCDHFYYELIVDSQGIHVRPDMVRLAAKTVGVDRLVAITDCCTGSEDDSDLNMFNGELHGSKLTMNYVARNLKALGFSLPQITRMTAENPARAIRVFDNMGSLSAGKLANIVVTDENFKELEVYLHGEKVN